MLRVLKMVFVPLFVGCILFGCEPKQAPESDVSKNPEEESSSQDSDTDSTTTAKVVTSGGLSVEETAKLAAEGKLDFSVNLIVFGSLPEYRNVFAEAWVSNFTQQPLHVPLNTLGKEDDFEVIRLETRTTEGPGISESPELFGVKTEPAPDRWIVIEPEWPERVTLPIEGWNRSVFSSSGELFDPGTYEFRHKRIPNLRRRFSLTAEGELIIYQFIHPAVDRRHVARNSGGGNEPQVHALQGTWSAPSLSNPAVPIVFTIHPDHTATEQIGDYHGTGYWQVGDSSSIRILWASKWLGILRARDGKYELQTWKAESDHFSQPDDTQDTKRRSSDGTGNR